MEKWYEFSIQNDNIKKYPLYFFKIDLDDTTPCLTGEGARNVVVARLLALILP